MSAACSESRRLPAGLRERTIAAARQARPAGRAVPELTQIRPAEAFGRAADASYGLLCALREDDWSTPALRGLDVQGLVGHLIGVEDHVQRCLSGDGTVADADHVASTQPAALRQAGRSPGETRSQWRRATRRTLDLIKAGAGREVPVAVHGMRLPLDALLVVRAFELWTHEDDIRRAVGLPLSEPDAAVLRLMTDLAARLLPHSAARLGQREPVGVHLVLTGPGGGTWDVTLGHRPAASVCIVTDAVGFCRLVASRVTQEDLGAHVAGDPGRAARVLAAAAALALD